jgi:hypothetical protein
MVKATFVLKSGATINLDGTPEDVKQLLDYYNSSVEPRDTIRAKKVTSKKSAAKPENNESEIDLTRIISDIKNCDEAESIETNILDRTSQVNRTLLPLYIVHEHFDNAFGLTTGQIHTITKSLGIPISQANASHTLAGTANRYVVADRVARKGQPTKYQLSRKGLAYLKNILQGG